MAESQYNKFSRYLKNKYGEKIYKIPLNIPCTCPNRDGTKGTGGCIFCGEEAADFEMLEASMSIDEQIAVNMKYIGQKYNADGFIAYFQNFSNTYLDFNLFKQYMTKACVDNIAALYISTRPDCIFECHAEFLRELSIEKGVDIVVELGLQSTFDETLEFLKRRHTADDFFKAVKLLKKYNIGVCAHMITDIPFESIEQVEKNAIRLSAAGIDQVKCHSLFVLRDTELGRMYLDGQIKMGKCSDFIDRTIVFLRNLDKSIVVQRLMGRAPEHRTLFCNYGRSWRAVVNEIEEIMREKGWFQGDLLI